MPAAAYGFKRGALKGSLEMNNEQQFEFIRYHGMKHIKVFVNNITHCTLHLHSAWEFGFVIEGSATIKTHQGTFCCEKNDIILFEPYAFHEITTNNHTPTFFAFIQISPHFCMEYFQDFHNAHFLAQKLNSHLSDAQIRTITRLITLLAHDYFAQAQYYQIHCVGYLCRIVEMFLSLIPNEPYSPMDQKRNRKREMRMQGIVNYIEMHFSEPNILNDIAKEEGLSVPYLSSFFRQYFQMTFQEYIRILRFDKALNMFGTTKSLVEICTEVGFSSIRYLNNCCRREFGMSASEYRALQKKKSDDSGMRLEDPLTNTVYVYDPQTSIRILKRLL